MIVGTLRLSVELTMKTLTLTLTLTILLVGCAASPSPKEVALQQEVQELRHQIRTLEGAFLDSNEKAEFAANTALGLRTNLEMCSATLRSVSENREGLRKAFLQRFRKEAESKRAVALYINNLIPYLPQVIVEAWNMPELVEEMLSTSEAMMKQYDELILK